MSNSPHKRRRCAALARLPAEPGEKVVPYFAADFAPCGCETHQHQSVPAVVVAWRVDGDRYRLRCLNCGHVWTRAMLRSGAGRGRVTSLDIDIFHPEERAARAARRAA